MNDTPRAHLTCPSCTATTSDAMQEGELLFAAKRRLRERLGAQCPRGTSYPCQMRGENKRGV